jgi:hypothetical protein
MGQDLAARHCRERRRVCLTVWMIDRLRQRTVPKDCGQHCRPTYRDFKYLFIRKLLITAGATTWNSLISAQGDVNCVEEERVRDMFCRFTR